MKDSKKEITERFLLLMDEMISSGMSARQFAKTIGEYPSNLSLYKTGERYPTVLNIANACSAFGYSANWILLGYGEKRLTQADTVPLEKRVQDLEIQIRQIKRRLKT